MINTTIGKYRITRLIGEGGMASVFEAEHEMLGTKVAIKVLSPILSANDQIKERFRNEAKIMASLDHPNITKVIDYEEQDQHLFIVMEYLVGQDLRKKIELNGSLSEKEIIDIFSQTLSAFEYAHERGVVHRDIKPSNIFLLHDGRVKILDFGISKLFGQGNELTQTGMQMGTPMYMSPEQVKAVKSIDYRSDIYSLGVTMYYAINGKPPYDSKTDSNYDIYTKIVNEPLPQFTIKSRFSLLAQKACQKNREDRFQSCSEWRSILLVETLNQHHKTNDLTLVQSTNELINNDFKGHTTKNDSPDFEAKNAESNEVDNFIVTKINDRSDIKYGVINLNGDWILPPNYNEILLQSINGELYYLVKEDVELHWTKVESKWRLLKKDNLESIYTLPYEIAGSYDAYGFCTAGIGKMRLFDTKFLYGKIDFQGKWVIKPNYDRLGDFDKNQLCTVSLGSKSGLMNTLGEVNYFVNIESIADIDELGYRAWVKSKAGVINKDGDWIIQPLFKGLHSFDKKLRAVAIANNSESFGVINERAEWLIQPRFEFLSGVEETDFWIASEKVKRGIIDINGKWLIPPKFDGIFDYFEDGKLIVKINDKAGVVDLNGNWVIEPIYKDMRRIIGVESLFYAALNDTKYGILNSENKWVIDPIFDYYGFLPII